MCPACVRYFQRLAESRSVPQVVTDPVATHLFMADGRHLLIHGVRPSTPGAGQGRAGRH
jgi:hypothetical protein